MEGFNDKARDKLWLSNPHRYWLTRWTRPHIHCGTFSIPDRFWGAKCHYTSTMDSVWENSVSIAPLTLRNRLYLKKSEPDSRLSSPL